MGSLLAVVPAPQPALRLQFSQLGYPNDEETRQRKTNGTAFRQVKVPDHWNSRASAGWVGGGYRGTACAERRPSVC